VSNALLALWIMLIGADRIDLAGGRAPFLLTPFLALTPVVIASELVRHHRERRPVRASPGALGYALAAGALVCLAFASVFVAQEMRVAGTRAALLAVDVAGTFAVAVLCADRPNAVRVMAAGVIASLVVFAAFDVLEALCWIGRLPETLNFGPVSIALSGLQNVGPLPRLAGPVADANRAGFVLIVYAAIVAAGARHVWVRRAALVVIVSFLLLTVSRSALLGASTALVVTLLTTRTRVALAPLAAATAALVLVAGLSLAAPRVAARVSAAVASPVTQRLSTTEGSARGHLALIERGLGEATESVSRAAIGLGYGNSYLVLQDVFPGNRYGNFHSLYVTMFAEAGVAALVLTLVLVFTPAAAGGPWRAVIAGAIVFNIFYQTTTEPAFWFVLAAAWLTMPRRAPRRT